MDQVIVRPLGGLDEIGRNCTVIEYGETIIVIDVGLMFPEDDMPGVDLVIPDMRYLVQNRDKIKGIIITHGHEDHIGALSYLLRDVSAPIYATSLTAGLIEVKLKSQNLLQNASIHVFKSGEEIVLGPFRVTPFHVNHSIPDAVGLAIRTPVGLIVHTGDFKIDHTPIEGRTIDLGALAKLANEGVILLLSDSTNAESPGYTQSESKLIETFQRVFAQAKGRIIVTTFASLLSRVQLVIDTAERYGRKVAIAGRSMEEYSAIAERLGYMHFPAKIRVDLKDINDLPDNQVVVLATGSQGEPNAALARMASSRFRQLQVREGDTVVLSAKAIPGNENAIYRNIDNLFKLGATVVYGERAGLHVSGHAAQEELKLMLNLLRPLYFMPVHGAPRMLKTHAQLAYDLGWDARDVFVLENGQAVRMDRSGVSMGEAIEIDYVYVDGSLVGDVGTTILRDRRALAQDGFVIARVSLEAGSGAIIGDPEIISQGFVYIPESGELLDLADTAILESIASNGHVRTTDEETGLRIKRSLERLFYRETKRRPVVIPIVTTD